MNIYESLNAVMADCKPVAKSEKNPQQGYKFRGIDMTMNTVNPALTKNKVFVTPEVVEMQREERQSAKGGLLIYSVAKVKYTFYAEDGTSVTATVIGEGMDSGDKSMNKAMSAAFKYALFQVLCIPTEEMIDSEKDSPEPLPKQDKVTERHLYVLQKKCKEKGIDPAYFGKKFGIAQATDMTMQQFKAAMEELEAK